MGITLSPRADRDCWSPRLTLSRHFDMFQYMQDASSTLPSLADLSTLVAKATAVDHAEAVIDDYATAELRLGELIGSGRHGIVVRAQHPNRTSGEVADVAVKVPASGRSLKNEAMTLRRFGHPNIVKLLAGPLPNGGLILEYCSRGSLADRGNAPLSASEAATILRQVGSALSHLHQCGWIHGDVSLNNIAIRGDGTLTLIDFATARRADGAPLSEGTAEFAGGCRTARPELDLRCLAAAVLSQMPDPTQDATVSVDIRKLRQALLSVIERCDAGDLVTRADLVVGAPTEDVQILGQKRQTTGSPNGPKTREFGPRPGGDGTDESGDPPVRNRKGWVVATVAFLGVVALGSTLLERTRDQPPELAALATIDEPFSTRVSAPTSLRDAGIQWQNGVAVRKTPSGPVSYNVGGPGDIAAVGDWNCDGTSTLGVYRPSTGSWFAFSSWEPASASTVHLLEPGRSTVLVERQAGGCDVAVVTS